MYRRTIRLLSAALALVLLAAPFFSSQVCAMELNSSAPDGSSGNGAEYLKKTIQKYDTQMKNLSEEIALLEAAKDGNVEAVNQLSEYLGDDVISEINSLQNSEERVQRWNSLIEERHNQYDELDREKQEASALLESLVSSQSGSMTSQSNILTAVVAAVVGFILGAATMFIIRRKK